MALKFLSSHTPGGSSSKDVKVFEIRLDNDYIVFRGAEEEASSASLSGSLVLCLADAMMIHHVKLTLTGIVHMSYTTTSTSAMTGRKTAFKEKAFYEKTWTFKEAGKGRSEILPSDNYEWRFDTILDGTLPESVEGPRDSWIVYRLKAEICRKRGKDIVVRKPLRVVRTLGATALELSHAMSVENIWPNKVEYSISTPSKAVVFGSFLQVDFKLVPLLKGLIIGNITTQLKEEQEFVLDPEWGIPALNGGITREDRIIAWDNYQLKDSDEQIIDEEAEGYQFSRYLELPKTLNDCLQDCNVKGIKIRHKVKFNVQLHNPDGHTSELRANLPVALYISPSLPLNDNNDLVDQSPQAGRAAVENDLAHTAPPVYGRHKLDQLYSEVDLSGYRTPGAALSSSSTPYPHSRNISSENLASLNAITNSSPHVSATALQYRLQNLRASDRHVASSLVQEDYDQTRSTDLSRRNSNTHAHSESFASLNNIHEYFDTRVSSAGVDGQNSGSEHSSRSGSAHMSRQSSAEDTQQTYLGPQSPGLFIDHYEDLVKVPSYSTAVRTPLSRNASAAHGLPTYGAVLSASRADSPVEPPSAHLYTPRSGSWTEESRSAVVTANRNVFGQRRSASQSRQLAIPEATTRRTVAGRG